MLTQKKFFYFSALNTLWLLPLALLMASWQSLRQIQEGLTLFTQACLQTLIALGQFIIHNNLYWLILVSTLLFSGFLKGVFFLINQNRRRRQLQRELSVKTITAFLHQSLEVKVVRDSRPLAFTLGIIKPQIYLSTSLIKKLNCQELRAVLYHEHCHQVNHHPLILFLIRAWAAFLYFLPILKNVVSFVDLKLEFNADQHSIKAVSRQALVSALFKIKSSELDSPLAAITGFTKKPGRLELLLTSKNKPKLELSKKPLAVSCLILGVLGLVLFKPPISQAHFSPELSSNDFLLQTNYCHSPNQSVLRGFKII